MRIAITHARVRVEERLLFEAFAALGVEAELVDLREVVFDGSGPGEWARFDVVVDRSLSLTSTLTAVAMLESYGIRCVNGLRAIELCSDKLATTLALERSGVPTPRVLVATGSEAALAAVEQMGYPAVLKPTVGSWGRLVSRVNDRDAAEAVIEHRSMLGSAQQQVFYVQEFIEKPGRDIRVFVVGGEPIAAIARASGHWVTNTARGAVASGHAIGPELGELCRRASACVGADVVAVDVLECPQRGLLVNELNHSMEFRNSIETTGVNIPGLVARHVVRVGEGASAQALETAS